MGRIRPLARTRDLVTEEVDDELLVYDKQRDVACRLNRSASLVWQSSDGKRTVADLVAVLSEELGEQADEDMVMIALDSLADHELIESGYERRDTNAARVNRRRFIRRVGVAAIGMPVVATMVVPMAAAAGSGGGYTPYYSQQSDRRLKRNISTLVGRP
jgi:Coenzyme PQQ synthesis protein D (PqqD)